MSAKVGTQPTSTTTAGAKLQNTTQTPAPSRAFLFFAASLGSCGAVTVSNIFEVVKVRLQLQGELAKRNSNAPTPYKNVLQAMGVIAKNEGVFALQKGLLSAYAYQVMLNGVRVGLYEPIKNIVSNTFHNVYGLGDNRVFVGVVSGSISGMMGAVLGSPFYLVKTRLQSYSTFASIGHQHKYNGVVDGLRRIYTENGVKGLYQGVTAASIRVAFSSPVQLVSYDLCKAAIERFYQRREAKFANSAGSTPSSNDLKVVLPASMISSIFLVLAMNPFDVVGTRIYNQKKDPITHKGLLYSGIFDCVTKIYRTEGILGFAKGLFAHYLRVGPHTVLMFVFFEQIKNFRSRLY